MKKVIHGPVFGFTRKQKQLHNTFYISDTFPYVVLKPVTVSASNMLFEML